MLDWFARLGGRKRTTARARRKELGGDLVRATELYLEAGLPEEAARVLLLRADGERDPERRMVLCAQAARHGGTGAHAETARRRKALLGFDLLKASAGATLQGELLRVGAELEACGEWERAVEAYALAGDEKSEVRVLQEAGAIEQLEARLSVSDDRARKDRDRQQLLRTMADLDQIAERRRALAHAREWLERHDDESVAHAAASIRDRLAAGPLVMLRIGGEPLRHVLGESVTVGRSGADVLVHSSAVSRQHLRLFRRDGEAWAEDLDTRNGTTLAGARVVGALRIGEGLDLLLGGSVPCRIRPLDASATASLDCEVAGVRHIVALGPLHVGPPPRPADWQLLDGRRGGDRFVVLHTPEGATPPHLGGFLLGREVELCVGDELRASRQGPVCIEVLANPDGER